MISSTAVWTIAKGDGEASNSHTYVRTHSKPQNLPGIFMASIVKESNGCIIFTQFDQDRNEKNEKLIKEVCIVLPF